jgi:ABC-type Na+ efflux pump permease subunit
VELSQRKSTVLLMSIATVLVIASDSSIVLSMQQSVFAQVSAIQSQSITIDQGSTGTGSTGNTGTSGSNGSHCITLFLWIFTLTICY